MKGKETFKERTLKPKFIKKAGMWCTTSFKDGKQVQEWS